MILQLIMLILAFGADGTDRTGDIPVADKPQIVAPDTDVAAAPDETPAPAQDTAPASTLQAEDQTPTGQFTTATEVKPILTATKANWMAVRDYNGQDLLYVTHLWAWRCGLVQVEYAINGGDFQDWPLPACHIGTAQPNAITESDGLPYKGFARGSINEVTVRLTYDDLSVDNAQFPRASILLP